MYKKRFIEKKTSIVSKICKIKLEGIKDQLSHKNIHRKMSQKMSTITLKHQDEWRMFGTVRVFN